MPVGETGVIAKVNNGFFFSRSLKKKSFHKALASHIMPYRSVKKTLSPSSLAN